MKIEAPVFLACGEWVSGSGCRPRCIVLPLRQPYTLLHPLEVRSRVGDGCAHLQGDEDMLTK